MIRPTVHVPNRHAAVMGNTMPLRRAEAAFFLVDG